MGWLYLCWEDEKTFQLLDFSITCQYFKPKSYKVKIQHVLTVGLETISLFFLKWLYTIEEFH